MKIWELRSSFDDYQSFQLLKYKEDKNILKGSSTPQQFY